MADDSFGVQFNYGDAFYNYRDTLDRIGQEVFPKTCATLLNRAVFQVKKALDEYTKTAVDRPTRFTAKAWSYKKADWRRGGNMKATIQANKKQAQYLWFLLYGGARRGGDAGTNRFAKDMFGFTSQLSEYGGVDRKFIKKLGQRNKKEKKARATLEKRRQNVRNQKTTRAKKQVKLDKIRWQILHPDDPGIFFGTVHGVKGYWQRPQRMLGSERRSLIENARQGQSDEQRAAPSSIGYTRVGESVKLLAGVYDETNYTPSFDYAGEVAKAFRKHFTERAFQSSMSYNVSRFRNAERRGLT